MVDFLFLDFDGVLHPPYDGLPTPKEVCFCHLPRFEAVMRQHPGVHIVISSTWRQQFGLAQLRGYFGADIAQRIVGITSSYPADGALRLHVREWEFFSGCRPTRPATGHGLRWTIHRGIFWTAGIGWSFATHGRD